MRLCSCLRCSKNTGGCPRRSRFGDRRRSRALAVVLNHGVAQPPRDWDWTVHQLDTTDDDSHTQSLELSAKGDYSQHKD